MKQARKIISVKIVSDDRKVFQSITKSIDIRKYHPIGKEYVSITDRVLRNIKKHPNITKINSLTKNNTEFNMKHFCPYKI